MAGISKKKWIRKGKQIVKYTITYRDIFGKQHTYGTFDTIREAKAELQNFNDNSKNISNNVTIGQILKSYIERCKKKNLAKNTIENYERYYKNNLAIFHNIQYNKLDPTSFQNWLYDLQDKTSPFVADGCYKLWRASFKFAKRHKKIKDNPFEDIEGISLPKVSHNHFNLQESLMLLDVCEEYFTDFYPLFFTLLTTGMRIGEALGLQRTDINFDKNEIYIHRQYTKNEEKEKTKTDSSRRIVYIFPSLAKVLEEHINTSPPSKLVFCNKKGNYLNISNIRNRWFIPLLEQCGFPKDYARIHDLRGTNIDFSLAEGLSIKFTQGQSGHSDARTTLNNYAKCNDTMVKKAMEVYENKFKKCEQNVSKNSKTNEAKIYHFPKIQPNQA